MMAGTVSEYISKDPGLRPRNKKKARMKSMKTTEYGTKVLEKGDKIRCQGITCTVAEITFQEYWEGEGFYTEFRDTKGVYRNWKQWVDGGEVLEG